MSDIIYKGPFKDHIRNHVELKKAVGFKYDADSSDLKRFDRFIASLGGTVPIVYGALELIGPIKTSTRFIVSRVCWTNDFQIRCDLTFPFEFQHY